ncbi:TadE/TadG family type IV pilus assembly protein [Roseovarius sp. 2305UL8-3]|uniref:TadE/TadG family type IV pilus assembly protein n=1 Tax=Roseovarius conchicola TaxID=3121636 RepID=UPI0035295ACC
MILKLTRNQPSERSLRGALLARLEAKYRTYERDEDGGMAIIAFFIFLLMLTVGGLSIDLMRHEMERTQLQATIDSAVLAGGGAPAGATKEEIKAIVEDFFVKSGKSEYMNEISDDDIVATLNSRTVTASADMTLNTYLMKLMGVNTLDAGGIATAEVRTPKLEVALVLDVSGSMRGAKLDNLKIAAKQFVTTILNSSDPGDVVISIVPFSWTTAPGEAIYSAMRPNIIDTHDYSSCLRFEEGHYEDAFITPTLKPLEGPEYAQQIYTSVYGGFDDLSSGWRSCFNDDYAEILAYSMTAQELHDKIDLLHADGNTSTHIGMKWGAALLDPAFAPVAASLQAEGLMDASLTNVPAAYDEPESLKIIVVMGDGANTSSYYFDKNSSFRGEDSDLHEVIYQHMEFDYARHKYKNKTSTSSSKCSNSKWNCYYKPVGEPEKKFYLQASSGSYNEVSVEEGNEGGEWLSETEYEEIANAGEDNPLLEVTERILDWEEAWGLMSPHFVGSVTGNWSAWNDYVGSERESGSDKNGMMRDICTATKANDVVVYSIGFSVPENGTAETELRNCASDPLLYYRATTSTISDAFGSIASNVQNLRLTQ